MRKICKEKLKLERFELPREEALKYMEEREEPYKVELINDLPADAHISFYKQGEFVDLCGSGFSCFRHSRQTSMASCGTYCSMVRSLNTIEPNNSGIRSFALILVSPLSENVVDTFFI